MNLKKDISLRKISIAKPFIDEADKKGVLQVLNSSLLANGPKCEQFEQAVATYTGAKYACAVSNGTCGLHLAVRAAGLKEGDEVITSPFSFIASANCLLYEKVKPVFVDIEEQTFGIDSSKVEKYITEKTKAILVVHVFGQAVDMDPIMRIARKYHLKVIEDACESFGAKYKHKMTGTIGDIGVLAFYANKQITTGEGGMILTNDKKMLLECVSMRNQGRDNHKEWLEHIRLGYNYRLTELQSSLGITQLKKIDWLLSKRQKLAAWYQKYLEGCENIILPTTAKDRTNTWFVYVVRIQRGKRQLLTDKLRRIGIQTRHYFPVIHLQPFYKTLFNYQKGDFPVAEKVASQTLALPFYIGLKKSEVKYISDCIKKIIYEK